jgi:hypothetical protein
MRENFVRYTSERADKNDIQSARCYGEVMDETKLREVAREYLSKEFAGHRFHMPFEIFHGKGPLVKHLKDKFCGEDLTSIPNYNKASVEPDIAGIIVSNTSNKKLWVIAEIKGEKTVSQGDRRQAVDYANATHAFRAYLISDSQLGQDIRRDIQNGLHRFIGMFENGQEGNSYLIFLRYLEVTGQFVSNR